MACMTHVCTECADRWSDNKPVSVCRYCSGSHVIHLFNEVVEPNVKRLQRIIDAQRDIILWYEIGQRGENVPAELAALEEELKRAKEE